jgi:hypothetical protein
MLLINTLDLVIHLDLNLHKIGHRVHHDLCHHHIPDNHLNGNNIDILHKDNLMVHNR